MGTTRKIFLYTLFTIGITGVFLVYLFPSEAITDYMASKVRTIKPGWVLDVESASPALPFSLALSAVDVSTPGGLTGSMDQIKFTPDFFTLLGETPSVSFKGNLYSGTLSGKAVLSKNLAQAPPEIKGSLKALRVEDMTALKQITEHSIAGRLNGEFSYSGTGLTGSGETALTLSQCVITLAQPLFNVNQLTFTGINAKLALQENRAVQVRELNAKGPDLNGKASGKIQLKNPMPKSDLQLTGTIIPHPSFMSKLGGGMVAMLFKKNKRKGGLPFSIRGTLEQPAFSIK